MASPRNPFSAIRWTSCLTVIFGTLSAIVGVIEMCVWLAVLGVFGNISKGGRLWLYYTYGGVSGAALVIMAACGLWCGIWVCMVGICGCTMRLRQSADKNNRTRIVVCLASGFNAVIFCPVQVALYSYLFTSQSAWFDKLFLREPVWWAVTLQATGIICGVGSLIVCIVSIVITLRMKPYAGAESTGLQTWDDVDLNRRAISI